jgi:hypothetical protein
MYLADLANYSILSTTCASLWHVHQVHPVHPAQPPLAVPLAVPCCARCPEKMEPRLKRCPATRSDLQRTSKHVEITWNNYIHCIQRHQRHQRLIYTETHTVLQYTPCCSDFSDLFRFLVVFGLDLDKAAELKKQGNAAYAQNDIEAGTSR